MISSDDLLTIVLLSMQSRLGLIRFFFNFTLGLALQYNRFSHSYRWMVFELLLKTFCGASAHADSAKNAGKQIVFPYSRLFIHCDAMRRTFDHTQAAIRAFINAVDDLTARIFIQGADLLRVASGGFFGEKISEYIWRHFKHG